ncbi:MAG: SDR family oxidoreductase [Candidatus Latescibacteria bacterium]|jgi:3-oxoacyl-[acyl-carrier protein] reductase|nr:SDR family oxidoreductase [Candidatus Latescibacterota bacterium]
MDLKDKVAIVTGGNGGLGQRICHALANAGCKIAVVYAKSKDQAEGVVAELATEAIAVQCDLLEPDQVAKMAQQVLDHFGRIDILINDAAYNKWIPFDDLDAMTLEEWHKILNVNLTGPMLCIKAVAPAMKKQGAGRIINISSIAGFGPTGSSIPYSISKAGLNHLTKCMAVSLAPEVTVNGVAPGYITETRATSNLLPEYREKAVVNSLLGIAADKDDCADQVVALCKADTITGQTLIVDSGKVFH